MDTILIHNLEVHYCVGVTEAERARPQRLLLRIELDHDIAPAARSDELPLTINYSDVCRRLRTFGDDRQWQLIETLGVEIAESLLSEFHPAAVRLEIRKFIVPDAEWVGVRIARP